jgi:AraC-like DNA-binding protein
MIAEFDSRLIPRIVVHRIRYYPRIARVAAYVKEHVEDTTRLDDVATIAAMSPSAYSRYFAEKTGMTFSAFVKTTRIEHALVRLEHQDCSITDLADSLGYRLGAFCRAFKDVVGTTPTEHRRRHLELSDTEGTR